MKESPCGGFFITHKKTEDVPRFSYIGELITLLRPYLVTCICVTCICVACICVAGICVTHIFAA